jgi:hypothetical protein
VYDGVCGDVLVKCVFELAPTRQVRKDGGSEHDLVHVGLEMATGGRTVVHSERNVAVSICCCMLWQSTASGSCSSCAPAVGVRRRQG